MPYVSEKIRLPRNLDRRVKLTDEDKEIIKRRHAHGESVRAIARDFEGKCSRRLIQFVLYPERLQKMQEQQAKEKHWKKYYNREQLTKALANLRRYKHELYVKKIIK